MSYQTLAELNTGDVLTETWVDQVKENFEAIRGSAVTTLPTGADNQVVRYKPNGAGSPPTWLCVFDPNLNGGAGAWAYVGGGQIATAQSNFSDMASAGSVANLPALAIPVPGRWHITCAGLMQLRTAPGGTATISASAYLRAGTTNIAAVGHMSTNAQFATENISFSIFYDFTAATSLHIRAENISSGTWRYGGDSLPWRIEAYPLELRP